MDCKSCVLIHERVRSHLTKIDWNPSCLTFRFLPEWTIESWISELLLTDPENVVDYTLHVFFNYFFLLVTVSPPHSIHQSSTMSCCLNDDDPFPADDCLFADTFSQTSVYKLLGQELKIIQLFGANLGVAAPVWESVRTLFITQCRLCTHAKLQTAMCACTYEHAHVCAHRLCNCVVTLRSNMWTGVGDASSSWDRELVSLGFWPLFLVWGVMTLCVACSDHCMMLFLLFFILSTSFCQFVWSLGGPWFTMFWRYERYVAQEGMLIYLQGYYSLGFFIWISLIICVVL